MSMRLKKEEFTNYLASNLETQFIAADFYRCPLASYLTAKYGTQVLVADKDAFFPDDTDGNAISLPKWAKSFLGEFDVLGAKYNFVPLTGLTALAILCPEYWEGA